MHAFICGMSRRKIPSPKKPRPPPDTTIVAESVTFKNEVQANSDTKRGVVVPLEIAKISKRGYAPYNPRKVNQDTIVTERDGRTGALLVAVFDGHGEMGDKVSQFFKSTLPSGVFLDPNFSRDPLEVISRQLQTIEGIIVSDPNVDTEFSGTTAVVCVILDGKVYSAGVGNSRAVLAEQKPSGKVFAVPLTVDHLPSLPKEKERIRSKGGRVFAVKYDDGPDGPPRVWLGHMDIPGLALSRSLGDSIAHTVGVICQPDCSTHTLTKAAQYLVVASDGLWEVMGNQEVVDIAMSLNNSTKFLNALIAESYVRWIDQEQVVDDTSVVIVRFAVQE